MQCIHALKPRKTELLARRYIPGGICKDLEYVRHILEICLTYNTIRIPDGGDRGGTGPVRTMMCYYAKQTTFVHVYIVYDIVYDIVRLTYDIKIQVLAILTYDVVLVYDVVRFLYDMVCTMYNISKKRTISYVFYRFLPFWRTKSHTISYVFWRCRIRCVMQHRFYTISYVRFQCRLFTLPKTYDIVLRRCMQYRSIRYAIRSIRYACLGRRQAWRDVLAIPLQFPRVLLPDPLPCQMVCIAQAQCRTPFPQSGILCCCQCEWRPPRTSKTKNCSGSLDQNSSWLVCI